MNSFRRLILWVGLLLILLLIIFSIYGAFIGIDLAASFFNTLPLTVYWIFFMAMLAVGIITHKKLLRSPGLFLIHLGCIAVLLGAIWGSEGGHEFLSKFFKLHKIRAGRMVIYEGMSEERVIRQDAEIGIGLDNDGSVVFYDAHEKQHAVLKKDDQRIFTLPFRIKLNDFRMEYYDSPHVIVRSGDGKEYSLRPVLEGERFRLEDETIVTIMEKYSNLKLQIKDGGFDAYDDEGPGSNPAVRTKVQYLDGTEEEQFAFANFSGEMGRKRRLFMRLRNTGMVRDYFSDLQVIKDGAIIAEKTIEVNDPLHYGGYHFYQSSYDDREGRYTVLSVMSDSGLYLVYTGLWMLGIGSVWIMWLRPAMRYLRSGGGFHGA